MNSGTSSRLTQFCFSTSVKSNVLGLRGRHITDQYVLIALLMKVVNYMDIFNTEQPLVSGVLALHFLSNSLLGIS